MRPAAAITGENLARAVWSGMIASIAYAGEMWADLRILRSRFNDFTLLGRPFSRKRARWLLLGAAIHTFNGTLLALVYGRAYPILRGPGWLRGLLFAQVENLALWPLMLIVDRYHPARREGTLGPAWSRRGLLAAVLRHAAYGVVLGALYRPDADQR